MKKQPQAPEQIEKELSFDEGVQAIIAAAKAKLDSADRFTMILGGPYQNNFGVGKTHLIQTLSIQLKESDIQVTTVTGLENVDSEVFMPGKKELRIIEGSIHALPKPRREEIINVLTGNKANQIDLYVLIHTPEKPAIPLQKEFADMVILNEGATQR